MSQHARQRILQLRAAGEGALREKGISEDQALVAEIRSPGSDQRCGVNFIARPSSQVIEGIKAIQEGLRRAEPDQYYYPPRDLHLTLLEICSGRAQREADEIAARILDHLGSLDWKVTPRIHSPLLVYNNSACAVNFIPESDILEKARRTLTTQLAHCGVVVETRHPPEAAHVTILRYIAPLRTPLNEWVSILQETSLETSLVWDIDALWLTWGANWYSRSSRIRRTGPLTSANRNL